MPIIRFITSKGGKIHDLYLNNLTMAITFDWKKKKTLSGRTRWDRDFEWFSLLRRATEGIIVLGFNNSVQASFETQFS